MNLFTDLDAKVAAVRGHLGGCASVGDLPAGVDALSDEAVFELLELTSQAGRLMEQISLVASGVMSGRSTRAAGHSGLAQSRGHRTPAALIQQVSGISRSEALRQVRVGSALVEAGAPSETPVDGQTVVGDSAPAAAPRRLPWHAPLGTALVSGTLSSAQHDAIRQGLGEPPLPSVDAGACGEGGDTSPLGIDSAAETKAGTPEEAQQADDAVIEAWSIAAERLIVEAHQVTVEELAKHARAVRDLLDPHGAKSRFEARYEARSFKIWTDRDGLSHGKFVFDDESAAWLRSIVDSALRPRRGGPRFVDPAEKAQADALRDDPRTNDQLAHDLLLDVLKAGSVADADAVFGTKQAGVRVVHVVDRDAYLNGGGRERETKPAASARFEDDVAALPESFIAKQRCNTATLTVVVDKGGNPLDVGREQRMFTARQRIALAVRDGGCRWTGCDRPASYCEAHHIDHWDADHGRTDIDRGILLCAFHHMQLHNNGWKITREGLGPFLLNAPPDLSPGRLPDQSPDQLPGQSSDRSLTLRKPDVGKQGSALPSGCSLKNADMQRSGPPPVEVEPPPIELRPPLPLTYGWENASPPVRRFRTAA